MSRYLPKNTKTGDFNTQRTLSGSFFVIPERLASIRAVVLAFTANKQTNEQRNKRTLSIIYIDIDIDSLNFVLNFLSRSGPQLMCSVSYSSFRVINCSCVKHFFLLVD